MLRVTDGDNQNEEGGPIDPNNKPPPPPPPPGLGG